MAGARIDGAFVVEPVDLIGRRALVTGASSGLGAHFATVLADAGAAVTLAGRRTDALGDVAAGIIAKGGRAATVWMDVTDAASVRSATEAAVDAMGGLDILINNAGVSHTTPVLDITEAEWDLVLDTNLKGAFLAAQAAARVMRDGGGGSIVNIASVLGLRVAGNVSAYCASKAGLIQLTKAMALELARHGIQVNALCPGYVATEINKDFFESEAGKQLIRRIPQRRLGGPDELSAALLLLCSAGGANITGVALPVDGGHLVSSL
jgi:NAD(P)-dependent dehydrogenase (short-subunit alcohol dehydrogenase family)